MSNNENIIVKSSPNTDWVLMRNKGDGTYFYISKKGDISHCSSMLYLFSASKNFFQCRSIACSMYDAFVSSCSQETTL